MNDYIVTLTNGDADYDQVVVKGFSDGNKAALQAEEDYNRVGWHADRVRPLINGSDR